MANTSTNKKRSVIWKCNKIEFQIIVNHSNSMSQILTKFGLINKGSNFRTLKARIIEDGIDLQQFNANKINFLKSKKPTKNIIPLEMVLVENSTYSRSNLKKRLLRENFLENKCAECGLCSHWNNKPICLQLDHKNGVYNDNRLCNLRLLCPNCHSQTDSFGGRKNKKLKIKSKFNKCMPQYARRKVERPSKEELFEMLWKQPTVKIAAFYGVSDKAISKWAKSYNIEKPPRGYWSKNTGS